MDKLNSKQTNVFFNNLKLLGLDSSALEKKYGIIFHKDMFVLPNKKGCEIVTYFLFTKLSEATNQDYKLPWPLYDKEQERIFQKTAYNHFNNFSQENLVTFPHIFPSLLSTFGGVRFYEVYLAFSTYVILKTLRANGCNRLLSMPAFSQESTSVTEDILRLSTIKCVQNFKKIESMTHASHLIWINFTKNLSECLRKLKCLFKEYEELKQRNMTIFSNLISESETNVTTKKVIVKICEDYKLAMRKKFQMFYSNETELWKHMYSEIEENDDDHVLTGQNFNLSIADNLPEECRFHLHKTEITSCKENGKLSVVKFLKLLGGFLKFFTQVLIKSDLSHINENCFVGDLFTMNESLQYVDNLIKKFVDKEIPDIEENIHNQKLIIGFDDLNKSLEIPKAIFFSTMYVQGFNCEAINERITHFNAEQLQLNISNEDMEKQETFNSSTFDLINYQPEKSTDPIIGRSNSETIAHLPFFLPDPESRDSFLCIPKKTEVPTKDIPPSISDINISYLDDIESGISQEFPIRKSWLQEPSLISETMPDISFDDL